MQVKYQKRLISLTTAGCLALLASTAVLAQAKTSRPDDVLPSRFDLFAGYSYIHPKHADINGYTTEQPINVGALFSVSGYFNRYLGVQAEGALHPDGPNDCVFTGQAGPIVRFQRNRFIPYVHALGGGAKVGGPTGQPCTWGWGVTGGAGFDYVVKGFNNHLAIRPVQADFNYNHVDYGPLVLPGANSGGLMKMQAYTLSAGLVLRLGEIGQRSTAALSCTVSPSSVYAGDPVTVTGGATGLNPKRKTTFAWTSTGGKVSGSGDSVQIATEGLAPGSYTVNGRVMQGSKAYEQATCTADFTVKQPEPPTISCSASPSSLHPGDSSTITAQAVSPSNRPLTYSYSASAGSINGSGATAMFNSNGAAPGDVVVNCNVVDDKGQSASSQTTIQVMAAAVAPAPAARQLCSISFDRDARRPARVNNEAKGCLDDVALTLQRESDSRLVMVGNSGSGESAELAAERAANAKLYLTREKGIDPSRITIRTGSAGDKSVSSSLVPAGASFDESSTTAVTESSVRHRGEAYGVPHAKRAHRKR